MLADWRDVVPVAGLAALAAAGAFFLFRKKPEDSHEMERERRAYLNRVGRIVEGQILEVVDHKTNPPEGKTYASPKQPPKPVGASAKRATVVSNGTQKLL